MEVVFETDLEGVSALAVEGAEIIKKLKEFFILDIFIGMGGK